MAEYKILLVEDDKNLGTVLRDFLMVKDFDVDHSVDGIEAEKFYRNNLYDLLILDIMMPNMDGFTLAKKIRKTDSRTPIIFLTAKSMQQDKIAGLKIGADDYITKPFNTEELLLRINAVLKRSSSVPSLDNNQKIFSLGKYRFDFERRKLTIGNSTQKLTSKEAELLRLLCIRKNDLLERNYALTKIWQDDNYFAGRSMDVYIVKLRNYLKEDDSVEITNVHGVGFKLISP